VSWIQNEPALVDATSACLGGGELPSMNVTGYMKQIPDPAEVICASVRNRSETTRLQMVPK